MSHCMILRNNECCLNSSAFFNDLVVIILIQESIEFIKTFSLVSNKNWTR